MKALKIVAIVLGCIIVLLLAAFAFLPSAKGPTAPAEETGNGTSSNGGSGAQGPVPVPAVMSADGTLEVSAPSVNALITSPVTVTGKTIGGGWFYEGTFPVRVVDATGNVLGEGVATAQPESAWTSTGTVPFAATISFNAPRTATGEVVLMNDNPSGLPQNAKQLAIPVRFQ